MAINRQKKEQIVEELKNQFANSNSIIFVDYTGLKVKDFESVRKELKKEGIDIKAAKKNLLDVSLGERKIRPLSGQIAVSFGFGDEITPAKIIHKLSGESENLKILAGIINGEFVGADYIIALAKTPSREELLSRFVGSINAPVSGLVNVLAGNIRGLLYALNAISNK